jgi:hypothetical protein
MLAHVQLFVNVLDATPSRCKSAFQVCSKADPDCNCFDYPDGAASRFPQPMLAISLAVIAMMTTIWQSIAFHYMQHICFH